MAKLEKASPNLSFGANTSPGLLNLSDNFSFLVPDCKFSGRFCSPLFVKNHAKTPNISPIIKSSDPGSASSFLKRREFKGRNANEKSEKNRRRTTPPAISVSVDERNPVMEMTLSVKTVLKDLGLMEYIATFDSEELFRKLSLSNLKSSEPSANTKYQPQKNHSISISPTSTSGRKRVNRKSKRGKHKNKSIHDDTEDDFTVPDRKRQSYIKSCIRKRFTNNYEKQINCIQDENVVFTDNKIYISLSTKNASLGSNSSLKKNRRVIYPTSVPVKLSGFLRHYDFSYEDENELDESKNMHPKNNTDEKLKFNMMKEHPLFTSNSLDNVVFEKVKVKTNCNEASACIVHVSNSDFERNDDSILTSSTFMTASYEADDEDEQWKNFLELRKRVKPINNGSTINHLNDSGFGSQLFANTSNNVKAWQDDEAYDNSFNEELEQRVSILMFPETYENNFHTTHFNNINNVNHITADKLS